jgi:hypothetical protein
MTDLSPAAQAVLDAYMANCGWLDGPLQRDHQCVAATLRAAADQVVPKESTECQSFTNEAIRLNRMGTRSKLLALAAELETPTTENQ